MRPVRRPETGRPLTVRLAERARPGVWPSLMSPPPAGDLPPLERCGFVRVPPPEGSGGELWMTCEQCGKSDHFWLEDGTIRCRCGARYGFAVRPDGSQVAPTELDWVAFDEGPVALGSWEWDPVRLGLLALVVVLAVAFGLYAGLIMT